MQYLLRGGIEVVGQRVFAGGAFVVRRIGLVLAPAARVMVLTSASRTGLPVKRIHAVDVVAEHGLGAHRLERNHIDVLGGGHEDRVGRPFGQGHQPVAENQVMRIALAQFADDAGVVGVGHPIEKRLVIGRRAFRSALRHEVVIRFAARRTGVRASG